MPLIEAAIRAQVSDLVNDLTGGDPVNDDPEQTKQKYIEGLTSIIIDAIKSADVTIPSGVVSQGASPTVIPNPAPIVISQALS